MALYGTSLRWSPDYQADQLASLVEQFAKTHGDIEPTRSLQKRIEIQNNTRLGASAPNVSGKNLAGETISTNDFSGQYVLIDFWASWCPPCRVENRSYAELLSKADPEEFVILGINLDISERLMDRAIKQDSINWPQISETDAWNSELAKRFGVAALPASFLLDPDGKIVAKNLRGDRLEAKLHRLGIL
nr:TlpA disulfide reductase family protein [Pelagicoccus albus]